MRKMFVEGGEKKVEEVGVAWSRVCLISVGECGGGAGVGRRGWSAFWLRLTRGSAHGG